MATRIPALIQLSDPRVAAQLVTLNSRLFTAFRIFSLIVFHMLVKLCLGSLEEKVVRGLSFFKRPCCLVYRVGVKYNWSSTQILQVLVIKYKYKYKYKYFAFSPIKYSNTSSTDTPSTSTSTSTSTSMSANIGWLIYTGNTRAVIPGKYRPVQ